jgi:ribonuclease HI
MSTRTLDDAAIVLHIDGSCTNNGRAGAKAGSGVFHEPGSDLNVSTELPPDLGPNTNQRAELYAAILALERTRDRMTKRSRLEIRSDSIYLVNGITDWIRKWKANGWTRKVRGKSAPVANLDLWQKLDALMQQHPATIAWTHVAGHASIFGNEMADSLATDATRKRKRQE